MEFEVLLNSLVYCIMYTDAIHGQRVAPGLPSLQRQGQECVPQEQHRDRPGEDQEVHRPGELCAEGNGGSV